MGDSGGVVSPFSFCNMCDIAFLVFLLILALLGIAFFSQPTV
jgi:hypothetical protein